MGDPGPFQQVDRRGSVEPGEAARDELVQLGPVGDPPGVAGEPFVARQVRAPRTTEQNDPHSRSFCTPMMTVSPSRDVNGP